MIYYTPKAALDIVLANPPLVLEPQGSTGGFLCEMVKQLHSPTAGRAGEAETAEATDAASVHGGDER